MSSKFTKIVCGDKISQDVPVTSCRGARVFSDYLNMVSDGHNDSDTSSTINLQIPSEYADNFNHYISYLTIKDRLSPKQLKLALESAHHLEDIGYFNYLVKQTLLPNWSGYSSIISSLHDDLKLEVYYHLPYNLIVEVNPDVSESWTFFQAWLTNLKTADDFKISLASSVYTYKFFSKNDDSYIILRETFETDSSNVVVNYRWLDKWIDRNPVQCLITRETCITEKRDQKRTNDNSRTITQFIEWYPSNGQKRQRKQITVTQNPTKEDPLPRNPELSWKICWHENGYKTKQRFRNSTAGITAVTTWHADQANSLQGTGVRGYDRIMAESTWSKSGQFEGELCFSGPFDHDRLIKTLDSDGKLNVKKHLSGQPDETYIDTITDISMARYLREVAEVTTAEELAVASSMAIKLSRF